MLDQHYNIEQVLKRQRIIIINNCIYKSAIKGLIKIKKRLTGLGWPMTSWGRKSAILFCLWSFSTSYLCLHVNSEQTLWANFSATCLQPRSSSITHLATPRWNILFHIYFFFFIFSTKSFHIDYKLVIAEGR